MNFFQNIIILMGGIILTLIYGVLIFISWIVSLLISLICELKHFLYKKS